MAASSTAAYRLMHPCFAFVLNVAIGWRGLESWEENQAAPAYHNIGGMKDSNGGTKLSIEWQGVVLPDNLLTTNDTINRRKNGSRSKPCRM